MSTVSSVLTRLRGPEPAWTVDALFAVVLALHGPVDVLLAALTWNLEGNTLVAQLGLWPWIAVKACAIALAVFVWWDYRRANPYPYERLAAFLLGVLAALGIVLILPNAFLAMGVGA